MSDRRFKNTIVKHASIASLLGALSGSLAMLIYAFPVYGLVSFIFSLIMLLTAFIVAFSLAIPLMKLRKYIVEPYYFLVFILLGFLGGVISVNLVFQKLIFDSWLLVTYGTLGVVCSVTAWIYLKVTINDWHIKT